MELSAITRRSDKCFQIILCGPVDMLWMVFIPYSIDYMFLRMAN